MPPISSSTLSDFPNTIDSFTPAVDGLGISSVINGNRWNKIEHALYRIQNHIQKIPHIATEADRKRLRLEQMFTLAGTTGNFTVTFTLSAAQMQFLDSQPFRQSNMLLADVYRFDGSGNEYTTNVRPVEPNVIQVQIRRLDPSQSLTAGTYHVKLTMIGL